MSSKDCEKENQQLMIIDTDCGIDDALALSLALSYSKQWKILGITCCHGNTTVDNVCQNVLKVLFANNETSIPVYCGCKESLVWKYSVEGVFGRDGFGNLAHQFPTGNLKVSEDHAVNALLKLAKEYCNQVTLVALGPLTNIAMAHRMDPDFTSNLKSLVVMGGNYHGIGNITSAAEYNFYCDPEAAHVVFSEANCPLWLVPWESTLDHGLYLLDCNLEKDLVQNADYQAGKEYFKLIQESRENGKLTEKIISYLMDFCMKQHERKFLDCDFLAMAIVVCPESIVKTIQHPVSVEVSGTFTRGQAVVERRPSPGDKVKRSVNIVTKFDDDILNELRFRILKQ